MRLSPFGRRWMPENGDSHINRGITGALVGRQPFGGLGMSGVGSKAGGPDYLLQFLEPRVATENTLRRGFAPGNPEQADRRTDEVGRHNLETGHGR
jgi:delta 1-pyrroline-5-carboxylate dehydrogenase